MSVHSTSQESHYGSDLLDELKENISPLRPKAPGSVEIWNVVTKKVMDDEKTGSHLLIVEDMGTPLRHTTYAKDTDHRVTRTPERKIISVDGFHSNSSPKAVPDCYATPLRRTTYVKNSPKLQQGCVIEKNMSAGKWQRSCEMKVVGAVETGVKSYVDDNPVPDEVSDTRSKTCRKHQKTDNFLRDVSRSPLILEDRLLNLQNKTQSDRLYVERQSSSVSSSRCSPRDSEYHTAVTTPYDDSFSENEDADVFLDSNICSETITGDVSLCQQQLAFKTSRGVTFVNYDEPKKDINGVEDLNTKPLSNGPSGDHHEAYVILKSKKDEHKVCTEVVSEVLTSEICATEISSSDTQSVKPGSSDTVVYKHKVVGPEPATNKLCCMAKTSIPVDDFRYSANILSLGRMSPVSDCHFTATGCDFRRRLSSTPVLNHDNLGGTATVSHDDLPFVVGELLHSTNSSTEVAFPEKHMLPPASCRMPGLSCVPFQSDTSCSFNSRTFMCATPLFVADAFEDADSYNRTYTKSAINKQAGDLSGSRPASRPLFADSMAGMSSVSDESSGVVPLDTAQSDSCDFAHVQREVYESSQLPKPELVDSSEPVKLPSIWFDSDASVLGRDVFFHVGGQTRHMISPGHKRQSLIARLHGDGQKQSAADNKLLHSLNIDTEVAFRENRMHPPASAGCGMREYVDADGSPVRKRPLIAALKPCVYFS